jgi:hypothetical protein
MSAIPEGKVKKKRKSRIPAGRAGARRVMAELLRRGFNARLADRATKKYDLLLRLCGLPPKPVHVRTVHVGPWHVRSSHVVGAAADQVMVYVLLGFEKFPNSAHFFVTRPGSVSRRVGAPNFRRPGALKIGPLECRLPRLNQIKGGILSRAR